MGGRYWITGAQLGMLVDRNVSEGVEMMQDIIDNQFIGNVGDKETDKIMKELEAQSK